MTDYELLLEDRIGIIRDTILKYDESNFYLSFSGGKDSTIVHYLLDLALPNNQIPRVYYNTGIEYLAMVKYVRNLAKSDPRIIIQNSGINVQQMLQKKGYPFKSKEHSNYLSVYQNSGLNSKSVAYYLGLDGNDKFLCPHCLRYQFTNEFHLKISDKCCHELKKKTAENWARKNGKPIVVTGMRSEESGYRARTGCAIFKEGRLIKFHPLKPVSEDFENWFIDKFQIRLCELYYPPYNFTRTGCKGCPFALDLQHELTLLERYFPNERKQCEIIWKPIYEEYRRLNYRLKQSEQLVLF